LLEAHHRRYVQDMRSHHRLIERGLLFTATVLIAALLLQSCSRKPGQASADSRDTRTNSPAADPPATLSSDLTDELKQAGFAVASKPFMPEDFSLGSLDGSRRSLSSFKGKVVFLSFWATWCGPCKEELPSIQALYNKLAGKGFVVLAVDLGEDTVKVSQFVKEHNLTFPILLDTDGAVGATFGTSSIPTNYLLDRSGRIIARIVGYDGTEWTSSKRLDLFDKVLRM
jgi:thiol-disulfide isomerase/thioredoxin